MNHLIMNRIAPLFAISLTACGSLTATCCDAAVLDNVSRPGPTTSTIDRSSYSQIYFVSKTTGSDVAGDGSQSKPWKSISHALATIEPEDADEKVAVFVASGTYDHATLRMKSHVDLYGGFHSGRWDRDVFKYATVLDGANERRLLIAADDACVDGFVFCRGSVRGSGAAILCNGTSPTIVNNRFVDNRTSKPLNWNPQYLHEIANDGGAICCLNGANPIIRQNVFAENKTEVGRGAAISMRDRCAGEIVGNVFLDNESGTKDPKRSSDGGAISIFDWSDPRIENNVLLENKARNSNDGGGIFVALWSSPVIKGNIFAGNRSADDGGALFIGGQEHRYDLPKDTRPGPTEFCIEVSGNLFLGNQSGRLRSGGMRVTMEARANIENNVLARDARLYIQASDVTLVNNTILEDVYFREMSDYSSGPIANNVFWGTLTLPDETSIIHSIVRGGYRGRGNIDDDPRLDDDQTTLQIVDSTYKRSQHVTEVVTEEDGHSGRDFTDRIVKVENRWAMVKSEDGDKISVWGDVSSARKMRVLPTFELRPDSPGIDRGAAEFSPKRDIYGDVRPSGTGVDIGADEVVLEKSNPE